MSTSIDERVVQMRFDNSDFDKNARSTMSVLEKLQQKLTFKESSKALDELKEKSNTVTFDTLSKSADSLGQALTVGVIAKLEVVSNLIGKVTDAGVSMIKSLTIDQVSSGFSKYEQKLSSVQTIMNATKKPLEDVNAGLQKLMWFTDETSYSFNDMVNNVSKFTSNRIDYDTSITAMMGIASAAGLAGASVSDASHAMDGFSKAIARGHMDRQNWQWIRTAHMDTAEFKTQLIDSAVAAGTLVRGSDGIARSMKGVAVSVGDFESAMSEGWMTSKVMLTTLGKFGTYADAVYKVTEAGVSTADAMELLSGKFDKCGEAGLRASQESKTFADVINAIKDAVSSGWMQTFETIFGNFEEAKDLWAGLYESFYEVFVAGGESRNALLEEWVSMEGRTELLDTIAAGWEKITGMVDLAKEAISQIFPPATAQDLLNLTQSFKEFISQFQLSEEAAYSLQVILKGLLLPVKLLTIAIKAAGIAVGVFIVAIAKLGNYLLTLFGSAEKARAALVKIFGDERGNKIADSLNKIIINIGNGLETIIGHVKNLRSTIQSSEQLMSILTTIKNTLSGIGTGALDLLVAAFQSIAEGDILIFWNQLKSTVLSVIPAVGNLGTIIKNFAINAVAALKEMIPVGNSLDSLKGFITSLIPDFGKLGDAITNFVQGLDPSRVLIFGFGVALIMLISNISLLVEQTTKFTKSLTSIGTGVASVIDSVKKRIMPTKTIYEVVANSILKVAAAFIVLAEAMYILAKLPTDKLENARNSVLMLIGAMTAASAIIIVMNKFLAGTEVLANGVKNLSVLMLSFSVGAVAMAAGVKILEGIKFTEVQQKMGLLVVSMLALAAVLKILTKSENEFVKVTSQLIAFSASLTILSVALNILDVSNLGAKIVYLLSASSMMIAFMGIVSTMGKQVKGAASSILGFATALGLMGIVINILGKMFSKNPERMLIGIIAALIEIVLMCASLFVITRVMGKNATDAIGAIGNLGTALLGIAAAVAILGMMDEDVLLKGTAACNSLVLVLGIIATIVAVISGIFAGEKIGKIGGTAISIALAMIALSGAVAILGSMDEGMLIKGSVSVGLLMGVFAACLVAGSKAEKAKPSIVAITVALGLATAAVMLLSLRSWDELMPAVAAFAACMVAIAAVFKSVQDLKFGRLVGNTVLMTAIIAGITAALVILNDAVPDANNLLAKAASIGLVLLAISGAMAIMAKIENMKMNSQNAVDQIIMMAAFLAEAAFAISALDALTTTTDPGKLIADAGALGILIVAISAAAGLLVNGNFAGAIPGAAAMGIMLLSCAGALLMVQKIPIEGLLERTLALIGLLTAISLIGAFIEVLNVDFMVAAKSALGIGAAIAIISLSLAVAISAAASAAVGIVTTVSFIITAIAGVFAWLDETFGGNEFFAKGIDLMKTIAQGFVDIVTILAGAIPILADILASSLFDFVDKIQDLPSLMGNFDDAFVTNGANLVDFITLIASAASMYLNDFPSLELVLLGSTLAEFGPKFAAFAESVKGYGTDDLTTVAAVAESFAKIAVAMPDDKVFSKARYLEPFGKELEKVAPYIKNFAEIISSGDINSDLVSASGNAAESLAIFVEKLGEGNNLEILSGLANSDTLSKFGEELKTFGESFKQYASDVKGITNETLDASINAASSVAEFQKKLYGTEGWWQTIAGEKSLSKFGEELKDFGEHFVVYAEKIATIEDISVVTNSESAVKSVIAFADKLPGTEGWLQAAAGEKSLSKFGEELWDFSIYFVAYASKISEIDNLETITASSAAASSVAEFASKIPTSGGLWHDVVAGNKSLSKFGEELASFGSKLKDFVTNSNGVTSADVDEPLAASRKIIDVLNELPSTEGILDKALQFGGGKMTMKDLGNSFKDLTQGLHDAAANIRGNELAITAISVDMASAMINTINNLDDINTDKIKDFKDSMSQIASIGATSFTAQYASMATDFENSGSNMIRNFVSGIEKETPSVTSAGNDVVLAYTNGFNSVPDFDMAGAVIDSFIQSVSDSIPEFTNAGRTAIQSVNDGMTESGQILMDGVSVLIGDVVSKFFNASDDSEKAGSNIVLGVASGMQNNDTANEAAKRMSRDIISTFRTSLGVRNGASDASSEIGEYIATGIQNGIEKNKEKLGNTSKATGKYIINAFKEVLEIKSPSKVAEDEIGFYLIEGIAEGIEKNNSAELAAADKAGDIIDTFVNEVDRRYTKLKFDDNLSEGMLETSNYLNSIIEQWGTVGSGTAKVATNMAKWQDEINKLNENIADATARVSTAESNYNSAVKHLGEDSKEAEEALKVWMDEQTNLSQYEKQLVDTQKEVEAALADEIRSNTEVTDAIADKISEVINVFNEEVSRIDTEFNISQLMYDIWGLTTPEGTTDAEKAAREEEDLARQRDLLSEKILASATKVKLAEREWQSIMAIYGEDSLEARKYYKEYLEEQKNLAEISNSLVTLNNEAVAKSKEAAANNKQAFMAAMESMGKDIESGLYDRYINAGLDAADLLQSYYREAGFNPDLILKNFEYETNISTIMEDALAKVDISKIEATAAKTFIEFGEKVADDFSSGYSKGIESSLEAIDYSKYVKDKDVTASMNAMVNIEDFKFEDNSAIVNEIIESLGLGKEGEEGEGSPLNKMINGIKNAFTEGFDWKSLLGESGAALLDGLIGGANSKLDWLKDKVGEWGGNILGWINNVFDINLGSSSEKTVETGEALAEGIGEGITSGAEEVVNSGTIEESGNAILNAFHDNTNENHQNYINMGSGIGSWIVEGITQGINQNKPNAIAAVTNMSNELCWASQNTLQIKSPSKVFENIGMFVDLGLAQGIRNNSNSVLSESTSIAKMMVDTITNIANQANDIADDMDANTIVITPVVDLDELKEGLLSIKNMVSAGEALTISSEIASVRRANENTGFPSSEESSTGTTINYTQNNYSPKALSRFEIYRDTKNQLSRLKGVTPRV